MNGTGLRRAAIGTFVALSLLAPHIRIYTNEWTRYYVFWTRGDALAISLAVLLLGMGFALACSAARRIGSPWVDRGVEAAFVLVAGYAVLTLVATAYPAPKAWVSVSLNVAAGLVAIAALACLASWGRWLGRVLRTACLVLSPAVLIVIGQLMTYPELDRGNAGVAISAPRGRLARDTAPNTPADVFLFVFDEWSYARTFLHGDREKAMPHLSRLLASSTLYRDAHSPHRSTVQSLPRILFQTSDRYAPRGAMLGFENGSGVFEPLAVRRNIFHPMKEAGFHTTLVGWYHPYPWMFGSELDDAFSFPSQTFPTAGKSVLGKLATHLRAASVRWSVALPKPAGLQWRVERWCGVGDNSFAVGRAVKIHRAALSAIQDRPGRQFGVFHYSVPHAPLVFSRDGLDLDRAERFPVHFVAAGDGVVRAQDAANYIARYEGNLHYLDTLIGEIVAALHASGRFDRAMLVLTSDHSWRYDPELSSDEDAADFTHVPLIIKFPHQAAPAEVQMRFDLTHLGSLLLDAPPGTITASRAKW